MRIYVDASAAAKLITLEAESEGLLGYLAGEPDAEVISSVLLETELRRAAARTGASQSEATAVLATIDLVEAPRALFQEAGLLPAPHLRSLDALHLSTALRTDADVLLTYDHRLIEAALSVGIATASPT